MTTFVRIITPDEESELKKLMASDDPITTWHAHCILMSAEGMTTIEIGEELGVSERSARNVVSAFNASGIDSLLPAQVSLKVSSPPISGLPKRQHKSFPISRNIPLICES